MKLRLSVPKMTKIKSIHSLNFRTHSRVRSEIKAATARSFKGDDAKASHSPRGMFIFTNTRQLKAILVALLLQRVPDCLTFDEGLEFSKAFFYFRHVDARVGQADIKIFYGYPESPNEMFQPPSWPPSGCYCQSKVGCLKFFFTLQSVILLYRPSRYCIMALNWLCPSSSASAMTMSA